MLLGETQHSSAQRSRGEETLSEQKSDLAADLTEAAGRNPGQVKRKAGSSQGCCALQAGLGHLQVRLCLPHASLPGLRLPLAAKDPLPSAVQ